ncbi:hypothetical protein ACOSP7_012535 [Xanthoceras sorbifolium]
MFSNQTKPTSQKTLALSFLSLSQPFFLYIKKHDARNALLQTPPPPPPPPPKKNPIFITVSSLNPTSLSLSFSLSQKEGKKYIFFTENYVGFFGFSFFVLVRVFTEKTGKREPSYPSLSLSLSISLYCFSSLSFLLFSFHFISLFAYLSLSLSLHLSIYMFCSLSIIKALTLFFLLFISLESGVLSFSLVFGFWYLGCCCSASL